MYDDTAYLQVFQHNVQATATDMWTTADEECEYILKKETTKR
jgi:hypothetical protein